MPNAVFARMYWGASNAYMGIIYWILRLALHALIIVNQAGV
jgi:hypothetical protein